MLPLLIRSQVIKENCQFLSSLGKRGPEESLLACQFVERPKNTAFHYHAEDFWALNVAIYGEAFVVSKQQLQWVAVQSLGLTFDDELLATFTTGFWACPNAF